MENRKKKVVSRRPESSGFSDRICNLVPSRNTQDDWTYSEALGASILAAPAALPEAVDLRQSWWPIGNQGGTGSCVGWACADGVLRYHLVTAGRLPNEELLSSRFVWMASKETDQFVSRPESFIENAGTSLKAALDIIRKYGCVLDEELPFDIQTLMYTGDPKLFFASASTRKIANYVNLKKSPRDWKAWLASNGPILAGLSVDSTWREAAETAGALDQFFPETVNGGHAVSIVGYDGDHFIIRNSWGKTWGDGGFGYASLGYIEDAFFSESYGISL